MKLDRLVFQHNGLKIKSILRYSTSLNHVGQAQSGKTNFEKCYQETHLETSSFQKLLLGLGSGLISITNPSRGDMIAVMGETTGSASLNYVKSKMEQSEEGRAILEEKPRINSATVDLKALKSMPEGTLGKAYSNFLEKYNYTPDTRTVVRFVDDLELAYVIQRYREVHDLFHTLLGMPTNMLGEVTVKWVEAIQTRLPMCIGGAIFGPLRLAPKFSRAYSTCSSPQLETPSATVEDKLKSWQETCRFKTQCSNLPSRIQMSIKHILKEDQSIMNPKKVTYIQNFMQSRHAPLDSIDIVQRKQKYFERIWSKLPISQTEYTIDDVERVKSQYERDVNRRILTDLSHGKSLDYDKSSALAYLVSRAPAEYAVLYKIFNEIAKRDPKFRPRHLFDFGSGVGTVLWAANHFWGKSLKEYFCADCSPDMNDLALRIIHSNDRKGPPLFKTVYQRQFLPVTAVDYDIVVSSYTFLDLAKSKDRVETLLNLWDKTTNYLVIVEPGTNAGFGIINEVREHVHEISKVSKTPYELFAPCPHRLPCPRKYEDTLKKTPCNFPVKYFSITHRGQLSDAKTELYSYIVLKKAGKSKSRDWARIVRETMRKSKHTICHLCTSSGQLNQFIFSPGKSGKPTYNCSKSFKWGDIVPNSMLEIQKVEKAKDVKTAKNSKDNENPSESKTERYENHNPPT